MLALAATKERKRPDGITPDEAELYRHFIETLDAARQSTFGGLLPQPSLAPPPAPVPSPAPPSSPAPLQMPLAEKATPVPVLAAPAAPPAEVQVVQHDTQAGASIELVTIRALGDIPPFVGPDMADLPAQVGRRGDGAAEHRPPAGAPQQGDAAARLAPRD